MTMNFRKMNFMMRNARKNLFFEVTGKKQLVASFLMQIGPEELKILIQLKMALIQ